MASLKRKLPDNVPGIFFVDDTCIDCDACRSIAPDIFKRRSEQSAVFHQPDNDEERFKALQALLVCPVASIGTTENIMSPLVQQSFPILIEGNVFYCGYHSRKSYGAASYFIQREAGNILVDSPRFTSPLVKKLEGLGGIKYMVLTHRDDVADHQKFHEHFNCERLLHQTDITHSTKGIEIQPEGDKDVELSSDLLVISVPGHTKGHIVLLYKNKFLFTGDHLAFSPELNHLVAFRGVCWYSWDKLIQSMMKLSRYSFEWVLPGHGRRFHASHEVMREQMEKCIQRMKKAA